MRAEFSVYDQHDEEMQACHLICVVFGRNKWCEIFKRLPKDNTVEGVATALTEMAEKIRGAVKDTM